MDNHSSQPGVFGRIMSAASYVVRGASLSPSALANLIFGGSSTSRGRPRSSYRQVDVVYTCVRYLSDAIGSLPMMVSTTDDEVIETGPMAELTFRPNPDQSGRAFFAETEAMLELFGRVHWHMELIGGVPRAVRILSPLQMKPKCDTRTGELLTWMFTPVGVPGAREEPIPLDEVHTITLPDYEIPGNRHAGLSPRKAAELAIAQYFKADTANESSLDNDVAPPGALQTDGNLDDSQREHLERHLQERHAGAANRRRVMILEGGLKWESMVSAFKDMEFTELKAMSREGICAVFGLKAILFYGGRAGMGPGKEAESAEKSVWNTTIMSRADRIAEEWTCGPLVRFDADQSLTLRDAMRDVCKRQTPITAIRTRFYRQPRQAALATGRGLFAWFDASGVAALKYEWLGQSQDAKRWWDMGVPLNAIIQATGAPVEDVAWGDTGYKPIGLSDYQLEGDLIDDPPGNPGPGPAPGDNPDDNPDDDTDAAKSSRTARADAQRRLTQEQLAGIWELWRTSWAGLDQAMRGKVRRHFKQLRDEVLANAERVLGGPARSMPGAEQRDLIGQVLFDLVEANGKLRVLAGPLLREGFRLGGEQAMTEHAQATGADDPDVFNIDDPDVVSAMRRREIRLTDVNKTVRNRLRAQIAEALEANEPVGKIAERIRKEFNMASARSKTIARTEVGRSVEEARHLGRAQAGTPLKSWLWSRKETGRPWHMDTERATLAEPVANDELFTVAQTGNTCPHPRATNDPQDDINCGCTTIARFPGDSVKAVIGRYLTHKYLTHEQLCARDQRSATAKGAA